MIQLAGFERVWLASGEEREEVTFRLTPEQLAVLDERLDPVVEPGVFRIYAGASSRDIRLQGNLTVRARSSQARNEGD